MRHAGASSVLILLALLPLAAQSVRSGSTGADGALVLTKPGTTIFDPQTFSPPLNIARDGVYHFTNIFIGKDVTVRLSTKTMTGPVFWLSQGPVEVDGTIDLNGGDGSGTPSIAGAGGYPGGFPRHAGFYPQGFTPNVFLVPLVGGRGGDGGVTQSGGAGGGALLIASSTSITINGSITANGASSIDGTGGGGGAIRLIAPVIVGAGSASARGGQPGGPDGLVRFETQDNQFTGSLDDTPFVQGKPFGLFLPPSPPASLRVISIGGISVTNEEFTINQSSPVIVVVEARFLPPGTVLQLEFFPQRGPVQLISTTPLSGTFELSRATASVTFPGGLSSGQVIAAWKQPTQGPPQR
jgi:hypothetical protein